MVRYQTLYFITLLLLLALFAGVGWPKASFTIVAFLVQELLVLAKVKPVWPYAIMPSVLVTLLISNWLSSWWLAVSGLGVTLFLMAGASWHQAWLKSEGYPE